MTLQTIAIDDELPALKLIQNFCAKVDFIQLQKTFNVPEEALRYITKYPVDLLFLDINMPSVSGIDLYRSIQQQALVIFTTAHSEYAVEGFNLNAVDYLLKPFTFDRFLQAVQKAQHVKRFNQSHPNTPSPLIFRVDYGLTRVQASDILFVEGLDDYLKIHLYQQAPLIVRMTMKGLLEKLPPQSFIRVHRSYIVAMDRIEQVRNKTILITGSEIPIGSSYEDAFLSQFRRL
ncbi:LytR/AlgR family response regulator transcription factor [Chitinophaga ginsengisoli]|uniref:LytTR family two component transcriptional regulator n=1 Tax=Chitinophaga ginsengisoli TaxID=363837 RepID=A0A2P8GPS5_9BACT|nr:LytTR family DNA-binding domain-containing protein [Chitinophaga ginsengisoli]PSL35970.1 LytTR family two component transcriptional regulator [Chitinophaga ginsengisoli]